EFFEQERLFRHRSHCRAVHHDAELIPQRQQTGWLDPDDRDAALRIRAQGVHQARHLFARLIDQASAQKSAPATEWTGRAVLEDGISPCLEDSSCRACVFGLEISSEAIDEQESFLARLLGGRRAINIAAPGWQFASRA